MGRAMTPSGRLPDKLYARLEKCLGFELREQHRQCIEDGINRALIDRDVQLDGSNERRTLYADIEQASAALDRTLSQALTLAHFPLWLLLLGAAEPMTTDLLQKRVDPRAYLDNLTEQVRLVRRGAKTMLERPQQSRGARKRRERDLMCCFIAEAISDAAGWTSGTHVPKVVARFARVLFPSVPKAVAHKSPDAFAEHLCKAFDTPGFGRPEKFSKFG